MMTHKEGYFLNQRQQSLYYQYWLPDGKPKAALLVIHGLNEHSGRYVHLANFFTARGYAVYTLDQVGHGKSEGPRSFVEKFSYLIDDLVVYLGMIKDWLPETPIYPLGHSLGGLINTYLLLDHQDLVAGAILSGSVVLVPPYVSNLTIIMGKIISVILPKLGLLEIDKQSLSRDSAVVQAYLDDPLVYNGKITVRMSAEMNKAIDRIARDISKVTLPVLILHGSEDKIVDPACSTFLYENMASSQKKLVIYKDYYHEIYNEPGNKTVFEDMDKWLEDQLSRN